MSKQRCQEDNKRVASAVKTMCNTLVPLFTQPESWYSFYRPTEGRGLRRPSWLVTYRDGLPISRRSPILVLTGSDVVQLRWSRQRVTTKPNRQQNDCWQWSQPALEKKLRVGAIITLLNACLCLLDSRDQDWCLHQASKHSIDLLWPWPLTPWPAMSTIRVLAPGEDLCKFALKLVQNIMRPASLDWRAYR